MYVDDLLTECRYPSHSTCHQCAGDQLLSWDPVHHVFLCARCTGLPHTLVEDVERMVRVHQRAMPHEIP